MTTRCLLLVLIASTSIPGQPLPFRVLDLPAPPGTGGPEAVADFDLDLIPDVLTPAGVLLGDGHGRFTSGGPAAAFYRAAVAAADLNGDLYPDLFSITGGGLRVDLAGPGLTFTTQPTAALPPLTGPAGGALTPLRVTAADIDTDGDVDVIVGVATIGIVGYVPAPPVLLLNDGSGTFSLAPPAAFVPSATATFDEMLVDADGDGDQDLVAVVPGAAVNTSSVVWWPSAGGSFGPPTSVVTVTGQASIGAGDFNGDGTQDLALTAGWVNVRIHLGSPTGPGPGITSPIVTGSQTRLAAVDLDLDGRDEIIIGGLGQVSAAPVAASGAVGPPSQVFPSLWLGPASAAPRDLDLDGDLDIAVGVSTGDLGLLMSDGAGSLRRLSGRSAETASWVSQLGDLDGDGDVDVVQGDNGAGIGTLLNDGDGFFVPGMTSPTPTPNSPSYLLLHAFDHDGDGDVDLYAARSMVSWFGLPGTDLVLGNTAGTFATLPTSLPDNGPVSVIRDADVDGDGDRDVILGRRMPTTVSNGAISPSVLLVRNLGGGTFGSPETIAGTGATYDLEISDFDGDGDLDVFQSNALPFSATLACTLLINDGAGTFTSWSQPAMSGYYAAAGDLDGDGLADVVLDDQVWINSGGTGFVAGPMLPTTLGAPTVLLDVDGDGDLDLVESAATVLRNTGGGVFSAPVGEMPRYAVAATSWTVPTSAFADLDRDGDVDVVGSGGRFHFNMTRQIVMRWPPRPGRPAALDLRGPPGAGYQLWAASGPGNLPVPPYGVVLLDIPSAVPVQIGTFAPSTAASPGTAVLQAVLPGDPALVGVSLDWQMLDGTPHLSHRLRTTVESY